MHTVILFMLADKFSSVSMVDFSIEVSGNKQQNSSPSYHAIMYLLSLIFFSIIATICC